MTAPVSLAEAKLFLRVEHDAEDGLIQTLIDAARARVEGDVGMSLTSTSPAPLRLAILMLTLRAYERGDPEMALAPVDGWIATSIAGWVSGSTASSAAPPASSPPAGPGSTATTPPTSGCSSPSSPMSPTSTAAPRARVERNAQRAASGRPVASIA